MKIKIEEKQVKYLEEWAFDEALKRSGGNTRFIGLYQAILDGIRIALQEVAENPEEVEEFIKAWRRD